MKKTTKKKMQTGGDPAKMKQYDAYQAKAKGMGMTDPQDQRFYARQQMRANRPTTAPAKMQGGGGTGKKTIGQKIRGAYENIVGTPQERQARKLDRIKRKDEAKTLRQDARLERKNTRVVMNADTQATKSSIQGYESVADKRNKRAENLRKLRESRVTKGPKKTTNVNVNVSGSGNKSTNLSSGSSSRSGSGSSSGAGVRSSTSSGADSNSGIKKKGGSIKSKKK